ncbi:hypothetical protein ATANTOWER_029741 [Ataeniobius toweri]|uniref:Uncharacterized protein n=1 Tax=Ataeniobius toweri TaxID=208326 RepID=A0ABU7BUF2_9TELE|nr:hypothetical protein [Ataeniobius toweri]
MYHNFSHTSVAVMKLHFKEREWTSWCLGPEMLREACLTVFADARRSTLADCCSISLPIKSPPQTDELHHFLGYT